MNKLLLALVLLAGLQLDAAAQHYKKMTPQPAHRKATRHRAHHRRSHARHTYYRTHRAGAATAAQPSPYHGDNTPANDGVRKNERRNLNYNTGQPLPPSNGGR